MYLVHDHLHPRLSEGVYRALIADGAGTEEMARRVTETRLQERSSRARLKPRHQPYWRSISEGRHLGYRKGMRGASWIARWYSPQEGSYLTKTLGNADDHFAADGTNILNWKEALQKALAWFDIVGSGENKAASRYTVSDALSDYLSSFTGKSLEKTRHTIERHIRPALGRRLVCELTTAELRKFQAELATRRSVYRANRKGVAKLRPEDGDSVRRGMANANRIFTPLKAALNRAFNDGRVPDDTAWRRVKPFPKVSVARIRYFTRAEIDALLTAAEPWFRATMQAALFTGARWSEIHAMKVRDVDLRSGTILCPETKGGRPRYVHLTDEGTRFFARQCAGKALMDFVFVNQHGRPLGPSHQIRPMAETCAKAQVEHAGFHILRHTYGSTLAMASVPLAVIAEALGHADERITRKHYAHLSRSYVRDAVRGGLGDLGAFHRPSIRLVEAAE
jgi:integrase